MGAMRITRLMDDLGVPTKFELGEPVLVPASRLANPAQQPFALVERTVLGQSDRSVCVDDGAGLGGTVNIASRLVHPSSLGFLVLRVGDFGSEATLLDPLAKSVLQFLRLLVPDNDVRAVSLRTLAELDEHWTSHHAGTSHVILVGHGSTDSVLFVGDGPVTGSELAARLASLAPATPPKVFLSLACLTGHAAFAKPFSKSPVCRDLIAPFHSIHGAAASQFCQSLLAEHLLAGRELPYAHARAATSVVGGVSFRRWRHGSICARAK